MGLHRRRRDRRRRDVGGPPVDALLIVAALAMAIVLPALAWLFRLASSVPSSGRHDG